MIYRDVCERYNFYYNLCCSANILIKFMQILDLFNI